jgi:beta-glucosidase
LTQRFPFLKTKRGIAIVVLVILIIIGGGLAGLAALRRGDDGTGSSFGSNGVGDGDVITDDSYFYGLSPPVYPSRKS